MVQLADTVASALNESTRVQRQAVPRGMVARVQQTDADLFNRFPLSFPRKIRAVLDTVSLLKVLCCWSVTGAHN